MPRGRNAGNRGQGSKWITKKRRAAIYARDGGACVYCGAGAHLTLDHLTPRSRRGTNDSANLVTACMPCNRRRGHMPLPQFVGPEEAKCLRRKAKRKLSNTDCKNAERVITRIPETPMQDDTEFEVMEIKAVRPEESGWYLALSGEWHLYMRSEQCSVPPKEGERLRIYGNLFRIRGLVIEERVYLYRTEEEHAAFLEETREQIRKKREAEEAEFRASSKPPLAEFSVTDPDAWAEYVKIQSQDPYSFRCVQYAADWAHLMEAHMALGAALEDVAKSCASTADTDGITGFMYGAAVSMLSNFWIHGARLRHWHNGNYGVKSSTGVVNPAILNIALQDGEGA